MHKNWHDFFMQHIFSVLLTTYTLKVWLAWCHSENSEFIVLDHVHSFVFSPPSSPTLKLWANRLRKAKFNSIYHFGMLADQYSVQITPRWPLESVLFQIRKHFKWQSKLHQTAGKSKNRSWLFFFLHGGLPKSLQ